MIKINKQKIFEILLTALVSTIIAILQNVLSDIGNVSASGVNPTETGIIGMGIASARHFLPRC